MIKMPIVAFFAQSILWGIEKKGKGKRVIPFHFKVDTFGQAGKAGGREQGRQRAEGREQGRQRKQGRQGKQRAGGVRKVICINNFVKWYEGKSWANAS
ncbi:hypothetical protein [Halotia branconii]|uniref:Uncharacterized protein n=1 Tax=Halotia branconii CENA392 TaxID=1539056 RepID=A0AAJ6NT35_9CYAN|nr:hypothetical protein [Halotia branconii]WGV26107.1 hypothetical protein QI031_00885 [Halotia branconii CENA392]